MTVRSTTIDGATNQVTERELTDAEILETFLPQVELTANKQTVTADGTDFVTVSAQLKSAPLSDGNRVNLRRTHTIILLVSETEIRLEADANGHVTHELEFSDTGVYAVRVQNLHSNTLEITVVV